MPLGKTDAKKEYQRRYVCAPVSVGARNSNLYRQDFRQNTYLKLLLNPVDICQF